MSLLCKSTFPRYPGSDSQEATHPPLGAPTDTEVVVERRRKSCWLFWTDSSSTEGRDRLMNEWNKVCVCGGWSQRVEQACLVVGVCRVCVRPGVCCSGTEGTCIFAIKLLPMPSTGGVTTAAQSRHSMTENFLFLIQLVCHSSRHFCPNLNSSNVHLWQPDIYQPISGLV